MSEKEDSDGWNAVVARLEHLAVITILENNVYAQKREGRKAAWCEEIVNSLRESFEQGLSHYEAIARIAPQHQERVRQLFSDAIKGFAKASEQHMEENQASCCAARQQQRSSGSA